MIVDLWKVNICIGSAIIHLKYSGFGLIVSSSTTVTLQISRVTEIAALDCRLCTVEGQWTDNVFSIRAWLSSYCGFLPHCRRPFLYRSYMRFECLTLWIVRRKWQKTCLKRWMVYNLHIFIARVLHFVTEHTVNKSFALLQKPPHEYSSCKMIISPPLCTHFISLNS